MDNSHPSTPLPIEALSSELERSRHLPPDSGLSEVPHIPPHLDSAENLSSQFGAFDVGVNPSNYQPSPATLDWLDPWADQPSFHDAAWIWDNLSLEETAYPWPETSLGGDQDASTFNDRVAGPEANVSSGVATAETFHSQSPYISQANFLDESVKPPEDTSGERHSPAVSRPRMPVATPNSRAGLPRRRSRYFIQRSAPSTRPMFIPNQSSHKLDPMQRWQESPPEDEPASMSAIMHAVNATGNEQTQPGSPNPFQGYRRSTSRASSNSGTSISSYHSAASTRSTASAATPDRLVAQTRNQSRVQKKKRRRPADNTDKNRIFSCTFCCDRFKSKYDWVRHEKSLHLNLETWVCAPFGGCPISPLTNRRHCAYCHCLEPSTEHLEDHNYYPCSTQNRIFQRKDHLVQHLRLVHHLDTMPLIDDWKTAAPVVTSRCGFCDERLASWDERIEHLAAHYRKGLTMRDWKGEHEFEPSIAARVMNAVPPYILASESVSMVPFSATNLTTKDHFVQISSRANFAHDRTLGHHLNPPDQTGISAQDEPALTTSFEQLQTNDVPLKTFMEVITLHLSRYARQQMSEGVVPTDEMFQREARQVLFGSEDSWDQTFADHPEWISAFREKHCRPDDPALMENTKDSTAQRPE